MAVRSDNIRALADLIESRGIPGMEFDMSCYHKQTECGTAGCILGWAATSLGLEPSEGWFSSSVRAEVCRHLGITQSKGDLLFNMGPPLDRQGRIITDGRFSWTDIYRRVTPEIAVATLRTLADTGEVSWPVEVLTIDTEETGE